MNVTAITLGFGFAVGALASQYFLTQSLLNAVISALIAGALIIFAIYVVRQLEKG